MLNNRYLVLTILQIMVRYHQLKFCADMYMREPHICNVANNRCK